MKAIAVQGAGESCRLVIEEADVPAAGEYDILIRVAAAGVNRADLFQAEGSYSPPKGAPDRLGLEVAGEVVAIGKVTMHRVGDKVCALLPGGGYAEYAIARESEALPVPKNLSIVEAASLPEVFFTAWLNIFDLGQLRPGETVLIHGGASGVGLAAIQLANHFGAKVFVTAGTKEKCGACERFGATAINYREEDFSKCVKDVNLILDMVGGDYIQKNLAVLGYGGRIMQIAFLRGAKVEVNLGPLLVKNITLRGSTLRSQDTMKKHELAQSLRTQVWPLLEPGEIKPFADRSFPITQAQEAHDYMQANKNIGKIVLTFPAG